MIMISKRIAILAFFLIIAMVSGISVAVQVGLHHMDVEAKQAQDMDAARALDKELGN